MGKKILASQGLRIAHLATPVVPLSKTAQRGASMYMESTVKKYERLLKYFIFQIGAGEDSPVGHFTARSSRKVFHKELGLRGSRTQVCNDSASRVPLTEVISPPRYARPLSLCCAAVRGPGGGTPPDSFDFHLQSSCLLPRAPSLIWGQAWCREFYKPSAVSWQGGRSRETQIA